MCVTARRHCRRGNAPRTPGPASAPRARLQPSGQQRALGPWRPPSPRRGDGAGAGAGWAGSPLTVSSVQMECTWVPNITDVKMRKSSPSKHSRMRRITVVGGEKELHSAREGARGLRAGPGLALPPALQDVRPLGCHTSLASGPRPTPGRTSTLRAAPRRGSPSLTPSRLAHGFSPASTGCWYCRAKHSAWNMEGPRRLRDEGQAGLDFGNSEKCPLEPPCWLLPRNRGGAKGAQSGGRGKAISWKGLRLLSP